MTFANRETSVYDARPVELYEFLRDSFAWRYTSSAEEKNARSALWTPVPIKRGATEQNQEMARKPLTLSMARDVAFLEQFKGSPPTTVVMVNIYRYHDGLADYVTVWVGRVLNVKFLETTAEVRCDPVFTSLKRPTLRRLYQKNCPHILYGNSCRAIRANFLTNATLSNVSGTILSSATFGTFADGHFTGGFIEYDGSGETTQRFIIGHVGNDITLNLPIANLPSNAQIRAYPGCDHTLQTCVDKFDNEENYGGQPFFPGKNPMNGTSIY